MRQLHIRAQSGPRPVTVAAVRALLAERQIDPTGPVLSLDGGRTWQSAEAALAVLDGQAVEDGAIDRALRVGPLHPVAMPVGALALVLLAAGIAFSGGGAAPAIRETPGAVTAAACATAGAVATTITGTITASVGGVVDGVRGLVAAGFAVPARAEKPDQPETPAAAPAGTGDLLSDWRTLLADSERPAAEWTAAAEALGKRTVAEGVTAWNVRLNSVETLTDANRAQLTAGMAGGDKALRLAVCEINNLSLLLLVTDPALAATCDKLAAEKRDPRISAQITGVTHDAAQHQAAFSGTLTAAE